MSKRFLSVLMMLALSLVFAVSCGSEAKKNKEYTGDAYTLHYHSYSGSYTAVGAAWAFQKLPASADGSETPSYRTDSFGAVYKVPVIDGATQIGIIFKTAGSWTSQTSTFTATVKSDGTDEFWVLEEDPRVYTTAPSSDPKVLWAMADDVNKINIKLIDYVDYSKVSPYSVTDSSAFSLLDGTDTVISGGISSVNYTGDLPVTDPVLSGSEIISNATVHFVFDPTVAAWGASSVTSADDDIYVRGTLTGWDATDADPAYKMSWVAAGAETSVSGTSLPAHFCLKLPIAKAPVGTSFKFGKKAGTKWFPEGMGNDMKVALAEYKAREFCVTLSSNIDTSKTYKVKYSTINPASVVLRGIFNADSKYQYSENDLGCTYSSGSASFKVFSPYATSAAVAVYADATGGTPVFTKAMTHGDGSAGDKGIWSASVADADITGAAGTGGIVGKYYVYAFEGFNGMEEMSIYSDGIIDPYATCVNGEANRAKIVDMANIDSSITWSADSRPPFSGNPTDAVVYEMSIRDFTIDPNTGTTTAYAGKYLGLTEDSTLYSGKSTGLNYLGELAASGLTHVQIMPFYDWKNRAGGETAPAYESTAEKSTSYDWGYMPVNFNTPEGYFSTNSLDDSRIYEAKRMIKAIHGKGLRVIMDQVYNHTDSSISSLNKIAPAYYFRTSGYSYLNGSGCGDEINSEYYMTRKFVVDSCKYWVNTYHVDGFRFDLMGLLDKTTMAAVSTAIKAIDPGAVVYGEGWQMGKLGKTAAAAEKGNQKGLGFGAFNDNFRDAIRGSAGNTTENGAIAGAVDKNKSLAILSGLRSANENIDPNKGSAKASTYSYYTSEPGECINYMSCHDNDTEWDRMLVTKTPSLETDKLSAVKLGMSFVLMAQGVPFFHAGTEFARTKVPPTADYHNSNNNADGMNKMDWERRGTYDSLVTYYKGLLAVRKAHPMLRFSTWSDINTNVTAAETAAGSNQFVYTAVKGSSTDAASSITVLFNCNTASKSFTLPAGNWDLIADGATAGDTALSSQTGTVTVPAYTAWILKQ